MGTVARGEDSEANLREGMGKIMHLKIPLKRGTRKSYYKFQEGAHSTSPISIKSDFVPMTFCFFLFVFFICNDVTVLAGYCYRHQQFAMLTTISQHLTITINSWRNFNIIN